MAKRGRPRKPKPPKKPRGRPFAAASRLLFIQAWESWDYANIRREDLIDHVTEALGVDHDTVKRRHIQDWNRTKKRGDIRVKYLELPDGTVITLVLPALQMRRVLLRLKSGETLTQALRDTDSKVFL